MYTAPILCEVVAHAQMVFASYGDCHIDRSFPVGIGKHLEHHQFTLVEGAFRVAAVSYTHLEVYKRQGSA